MYGSRKMNSLRTMTLEDCHGLLLLVLLRGGKRRQTHLVHLRRSRPCRTIVCLRNVFYEVFECQTYYNMRVYM